MSTRSCFALSALIVCSGALFGCSTTPTAYPYNPRHSEALNVARAAGMTDLRDLPWSRYQQMRADARAKGHPVDEPSLLGPSISALAVYFSSVQPFGLSPGKASGLDFLMSLTKPDKASSQSRLIAWMPTELAATEKDAKQKMTEMFVEAIKKAASETAWPEGMQVDLKRLQVDLEERKGHRPSIVVHVTGGTCDSGVVRCMYAFWLGSMAATRQPAPAVFRGSDSYAFLAVNSDYWKSSTWTLSNRGSYEELRAPKDEVLWHDKLKTRRAVLPDLEFYTAISRHLPQWAYLYLTPASASLFQARRGNAGSCHSRCCLSKGGRSFSSNRK